MPPALQPLPPRRPVGRPAVAARALVELTAVAGAVLLTPEPAVPFVPLLTPRLTYPLT